MLIVRTVCACVQSSVHGWAHVECIHGVHFLCTNTYIQGVGFSDHLLKFAAHCFKCGDVW